jgi:hypothetical protein
MIFVCFREELELGQEEEELEGEEGVKRPNLILCAARRGMCAGLGAQSTCLWVSAGVTFAISKS